MNRKIAGIGLLIICILIAVSLLVRWVTPLEGGVAFAVALVALGLLSDGYRKV